MGGLFYSNQNSHAVKAFWVPTVRLLVTAVPYIQTSNINTTTVVISLWIQLQSRHRKQRSQYLVEKLKYVYDLNIVCNQIKLH